MANKANDDFDDIDLSDDDNDMRYIEKEDSNRRSRNARRELERRMEMKHLRDMLDGYELNDFE